MKAEMSCLTAGSARLGEGALTLPILLQLCPPLRTPHDHSSGPTFFNHSEWAHLWMKTQSPGACPEWANLSMNARTRVRLLPEFLHRWAKPWMKAKTGIAPLCLGSQGDHPIQRAILLSNTRCSVRSR